MADRTDTLIAAAKHLLARGYQPVPVPHREKGPIEEGWQLRRLQVENLAGAFRDAGNIGVMCGEPSGWLIDVDLDCQEAVALADQYLPPTAMKSGRTARPNSHWWYRAVGAVTRKLKDPVTRKMVVEHRSSGQQTLVAPSIHPDGDTYALLDGDPAEVDAGELLRCVEALHRAVLLERYGRVPEETPAAVATEWERPALPAGAVLKRAAAYLDAMPPAISGQGGHDAAYAAATALVHGFELNPVDALRLLLERYNPRCEPAWSAKELEHKVEDAATKPHARPRGWLHAP